MLEVKVKYDFEQKNVNELSAKLTSLTDAKEKDLAQSKLEEAAGKAKEYFDSLQA